MVLVSEGMGEEDCDGEDAADATINEQKSKQNDLHSVLLTPSQQNYLQQN